jgi:glyoxylase-like metal-dependent hydrolase (beta-lactamase superfamily II)
MKKFLISGLFALLLICGGSNLLCQTFESLHFFLEPLEDGVYAAIHKPGGQAICNAGFVDLGGEILVFDSFLSTAAARDLDQAIKELTGKRVRWVVNSHSHNDHIRGNQVFLPGASIISSPETRNDLSDHGQKEADTEQAYAQERLDFFKGQLLEAKTEEQKQFSRMWLGYFEAMLETYPELRITLPDVTFNDRINLHGSKRSVTLIEFKQGHMVSDIVLYLPGEKILFTGDLVFIDMHPYLADGQPSALRQTLTELLELPVEVVVPGHGKVGSKEDISTMISYIDMAWEMAGRLKSMGKSPDETGVEDIPEPYRDWQFLNFFQSNLKFLYESEMVE